MITYVQVYLFAPRNENGKTVRSVKIEEATFPEDGKAYKPGRMLADGIVECADDTPDDCLLILGKAAVL